MVCSQRMFLQPTGANRSFQMRSNVCTRLNMWNKCHLTFKNSITNYCSSHSLSLPSVSLREIWLRWPFVEAGRRTIWVHRWGGHEGSSKTRMICWIITAAEAQDWEGHNPELLNPSKKTPSESALYLNRTVSPLLLHHSWDKRVCLKAPAVLTDLLPKQTNSLSEFPVLFLSALDTSP